MLRQRLLWGGAVGAVAYWLLRYLRPQHSPLILADRVVFVAGAASGVGRALAFAFARRGARLVLVGPGVEQLEAVRREVEPYTTAVLAIPTDLGDEAQLEHAVALTRQTFGRIDVLVTEAGLSVAGPVADLPRDAVRAVLERDLWAPLRLAQLTLPGMLAEGAGTIVHVGSGLGRAPAPLFAATVAAQAGLVGFTDALRREVEGTGVQVMLVLPGWTQTDRLPPEAASLIERGGFRIEHPDEVAERTILGLLRGEREVVMGGPLIRIGVWAERFMPGIARLYWRLRLSPGWRSAMRGAIGSRE